MKLTQILALSLALTIPPTFAHAEIQYAPMKPPSVGDDPESYKYRPDFALVEANLKLNPKDLIQLTPKDLKALSQEQLDQLYARLPSGPIPEGDFLGSIILKNDLILKFENKAVGLVMPKGLTGILPNLLKTAICTLGGKTRSQIECLGEVLWSGKRFYKPNAMGEVLLRNAISPQLKNPIVLASAGLSSLSKPLKAAIDEPFGNDSRGFPDSTARQTHLMLFPAHVYCGLSLFDMRKESIIIDYANGDDFSPYIPEVDGLVGRQGSWIRDEIRMIRPGLYLGRAYVERIFLLNFVLEQAPGAIPVTRTASNQCWNGKSWQ